MSLRPGPTTAAVALTLVIALAMFRFVVPDLVSRRYHALTGAPTPISERAKTLHESLAVADLHSDALLWSRDLMARGEHGHVDLPRLREGGFALQVFSAVNQVPYGLNIERNHADGFDQLSLLTAAQGWPPRTWLSPLQRVLYQAERLERLAQRSDGRLRIALTAGDIPVPGKRPAESVTGVLAVEGGQALEGKLANLERVFEAGFRMMGLVHFFDNTLGGSTHGVRQGGLTELGGQVVRRMEALGMVVDLAHASEDLMRDVVAIATRPVVVSHTGVRGTCDNPRNLRDAQLRAVARTGGLIGIGFWPTAVCGDGPEAIANAIRHAADTVGVAHVALGSDFDGAVSTPFDAARMAALTEALLAAGFDETETVAIMGGNALRLLRVMLPAGA